MHLCLEYYPEVGKIEAERNSMKVELHHNTFVCAFSPHTPVCRVTMNSVPRHFVCICFIPGTPNSLLILHSNIFFSFNARVPNTIYLEETYQHECFKVLLHTLQNPQDQYNNEIVHCKVGGISHVCVSQI